MELYRSRDLPGRHRRVEGIDHVDKAIDIDQIAHRANPALQPGDLHQGVRSRSVRCSPRSRTPAPRLQAGPVLVQRRRRALRGVQG